MLYEVITISYSEGFNPRPKMVFAMPMSVGLTSDNEYMDIEMGNMENIQKEALDKISKQLNMALPSGIRIKDICLSTARENIMQAVKLATYVITSYSIHYTKLYEKRRNN